MKLNILILTVIAATPVWALELPSIFSDIMVLQQEMPVRIWGKADPESKVTIQFAGQKVTTKSSSDGSWVAYLKPLKASFEGQELIVSNGAEKRIFKQVLVGEVWLGSGQSNMAWNVAMCGDGDVLLLGAYDPFLRLHQVDYHVAREPRFSDQWNWIPDRPESTRYISSVAYQFARDLRATLRVPVGIINSSVGGTPSIAWTRSEAITKHPQLRAKDEEWEASLARKPEDASSPNRPASLANGMVAPIAGYTIRGVIWYQGEEDAKWEPEQYDERLTIMIKDWRQWWGIKDLPFGIVQLANFQSPRDKPTDSPWANIRESQRRVALSDPNIGLAVAIDVGEANDIHPRDKFTVARRLARWALADVYGKIELRGGPEIVSAVRDGSSIYLRFNQTGGGLHAMDSQRLGGFTVSDGLTDPEEGTDFYYVQAHVASKTEVRLDIPAGKDPARVRYGWQSNPVDANLANAERLPASPFEITISK